MTCSFAQLRGNGLTDWRLGSENKSRPDDVSFIWPQRTMSLAANRRAELCNTPDATIRADLKSPRPTWR